MGLDRTAGGNVRILGGVMRGLRPGPVVFLLVAAFIGAAFTTSATAEDLKGKWYFGGNLSYLSTTDSIRSNAAIIFTTNFGDDGIPFTGDPNELQGCDARGSGSFYPASNPFCDPRPDDQLARESTIEETFRLEGTAGYGLTSWLSLQLDASYFKGNVGPIDVYLRETYPINTDVSNPFNLSTAFDKDATIPTQAGEITEIPVSLTAIVRFRKDSPLNPYVGAGIGMIFVDMNISDDVTTLNNTLASLRVRAVGNQYGKDITPVQYAGYKEDGRIPMVWPASVEVDDAFEWHLVGGAEYFFNDRWSMVVDARYTFADQQVNISLGGQEQVDFITWPRQLFRPDGSLKIFANAPEAPNPLCSEANANVAVPGTYAINCDPTKTQTGTLPPTQRVDPQGQTSGVLCPAVGDFDKDGIIDQCYRKPLAASGSGQTIPSGFAVVQGGKIDLTAFSVAIGMRWHF